MTTSRTRRRVGWALACGLVLLASGCSSGSTSGEGPASSSGPPGAAGSGGSAADARPTSDPSSFCRDDPEGFDPAQARETTYGKAFDTPDKDDGPIVTVGLLAPQKSSSPRYAASGGPADAGSQVLVVEVRAKLTRGVAGVLYNDAFTMVGPSGRACRQLSPQELPGVSLMQLQSPLSHSAKTGRLAFEVPRGADPQDYTVYFHPTDEAGDTVTAWTRHPKASQAAKSPRGKVTCPGKPDKALTAGAPTSRFGQAAQVPTWAGTPGMVSVGKPHAAPGDAEFVPDDRIQRIETTVRARSLGSEGALSKTAFRLIDATGHVCVPPLKSVTGEVNALDSFKAGGGIKHTLVFKAPKGLELKGAVVVYNNNDKGAPDRVWK